MMLRATLVAAFAAALLPLTGGMAHASCLDDAQARRLDEGSSVPYWFLGYVQHSGVATVAVYGDAAVSNSTSYATDDIPEYAEMVSTNTVDMTADFVDCVAG